MLTARKIRLWYRVHKWTSLICTVFLLMSCLTGLPMIFNDEIFSLTHHHVAPANVSPNTPLTNMDVVSAMARLRYPGDKLIAISFDDDEPRILVGMAPNFASKPSQHHQLIFDAHTGKLLEDKAQEPKPKPNVMTYINTLHKTIYAGIIGELFLACMALLFVIALVSGAVVYGPFMRRLEFGIVRKNKSPRVKWFDLHNLLGIVTLSWAFIVGATGIMNTLSVPLFTMWTAQNVPRLMALYHGRPIPKQLSSVNLAVETVQKALPGMQITNIGFPNPRTPFHYVVFAKGKTPLTSRLFDVALVDAESGRLTVAKGLPWYLRALEVSRPLHFGDYGGMPLKVIWALFDVALIMVLLSGLYLWLSRRKTPVEDELDRLVKLEELTTEETLAGALRQ